jgi:hypothetical protein
VTDEQGEAKMQLFAISKFLKDGGTRISRYSPVCLKATTFKSFTKSLIWGEKYVKIKRVLLFKNE